MKTLLVARLTLLRMIRAYYLMPVALFSLVAVVVFLGSAKAAGSNPTHLIHASTWALMLISDIFLTIGSILLVLFVVPDEITTGHMRMNLTKPASGFSILLGHFLGMFAYLAGAAFVMTGILTLVVMLKGGEPGLLLLSYIMHQVPLYGCLLAIGMALVFLFNRPFAFFILFFLAREEWLYEKATLCAQAFPIKQVLQTIYYTGYALAPPITRLDISLMDFMNFDFPYGKYLLLIAYCVSYTLMALLISEWLLRRRDI